FETNPLRIPVGQRVQLQLTLASRYAVLTLASGLALLMAPDEPSPALLAAIAEAAQKSHFALLGRAEVSAVQGKLPPSARRGCFDDLGCQEQLGQKLAAAAVLAVTLEPSRVKVRLFDVPAGQVVGAADQSFAAPAELPALLAALTAELLATAM